ncbi:N-acetyltransferase, partial [Desulfobulbus alkaliphilus]
QLGYTHSIVLGSEKYYSSEGYVPAEDFGIKAPFDVPRENFMVYMITKNGDDLHGIIRYAQEFGI